MGIMERLNKFAESGDVEALYSIIAEDPYILDRIDGIPFADTPLHIAAAAGNSHFAMEMVNLKPSFARKLNHLGLSPVHLALINGHDELVRSIITTDSELVRVKAKGMVTPLHYVAQTDNVHLLAEFLSVCPSSIQDLTVKCESVVHVAVKNFRLSAFKVLLGWFRRSNKEEILKWKDDDGNTVLHIAAATNQLEVMKLVIPNVNVNAKNLNGLTAMDILNHHQVNFLKGGDVGEILSAAGAKTASELQASTTTTTTKLADYLRLDLSLIEKRDKYFGKPHDNKKSALHLRNTVLVLATVIAAAAYQAVSSPPPPPPSCCWQVAAETKIDADIPTSGIDNGKLIQGAIPKYARFYFPIVNALAFYASVCTIHVIFIGLPYFHVVTTATTFLSCAYFAALTSDLTWEEDGPWWWWWYPLATTTFTVLIYFVLVLTYVIPLRSLSKLVKLQNQLDDLTRRLDWTREGLD